MISLRLAALVCAVIIGGASCGNDRSAPTERGPTAEPSPTATARVSFGGRTVTAEIADEPLERTRGLMFRKNLADDRGMLFLFPSRTRTGFWMKNTLIPLSIAYIQRDRDHYEVVDILDMEPCKADPCPNYPPRAAYDLALEVNHGWFDEAGVEVGERLEIDAPQASPE